MDLYQQFLDDLWNVIWFFLNIEMKYLPCQLVNILVGFWYMCITILHHNVLSNEMCNGDFLHSLILLFAMQWFTEIIQAIVCRIKLGSHIKVIYDHSSINTLGRGLLGKADMGVWSSYKQNVQRDIVIIHGEYTERENHKMSISRQNENVNDIFQVRSPRSSCACDLF